MALGYFVTLPTYRMEQCAMAEGCQENIPMHALVQGRTEEQ